MATARVRAGPVGVATLDQQHCDGERHDQKEAQSSVPQSRLHRLQHSVVSSGTFGWWKLRPVPVRWWKVGMSRTVPHAALVLREYVLHPIGPLNC